MTGRPKHQTRNSKSKQETYYDCCRICRADQTPDEEPLYHPCRCRGSIKFVHQSCLMDWLMTSKKKRCDLCKASYRFAKFYDPHMPKKLPASVIAKYVIKRGIEKFVFALRVGLVGVVWLVAVPMFTRHNWTFFFWVSEEGLVSSSHASTTAAEAAVSFVNGSRIANISSTVFSAGSSLLQLVGLAEPAGILGSSIANATNTNTNTTQTPSAAASAANRFMNKSATWLSDAPYVNNLTRSAGLNRIIVHCIEGIAITLVVVICFILIILVRDYVLQHQRGPEANAFDQLFEEFPIDFARLEQNDNLFDEEYHDESEDNDNIFPDVDTVAPGNAANFLKYLRIRRKARDVPHRIVAMAHAEGLEEDLKVWLEPLYPITGRPPPGYGRPAEEPAEEPVDGLEVGPVQGPMPQPAEEEFDELSSESSEDEASEAGPSSETEPASLREAWLARSENGSIGTSPSTTTVDMNETPESAEAADDTAPTNGVNILEFEYRPRANTGPLTTGGGSGFGNNYWAFPTETRDPVPHQDMPAPEPDNERLVNGHQENDEAEEYGNHEEEYPHYDADEYYDDDEGNWEDASDSSNDPYPPVHNAPVPGLHTVEDALDIPTDAYDSGSELEHHLLEAQPDEPSGIIGNITQFMWQDLDQIDPEDLPPLADPEEDNHALIGEMIGDLPPAQEADPFGGLLGPGIDDDMDIGLGGLQNEDGLNWEDPEAEADIEGEDFEGMMELVGMNGPLLALFQNALFCVFLVILTLLLGTFLPYNVGRITIWLVANPTRPVLVLFSIAQIIQDGAATVLGLGALVTLMFLHGCVQMLQVVGVSAPSELLASYIDEVRRLMLESTIRFVNNFSLDALITPAGEIRNFSAISHDALLTLKGQWSSVMGFIGRIFYTVFTDTWVKMASYTASFVGAAAAGAWSLISALPSALSSPSTWVISFETSDDFSVDPALAQWGDSDRFLASMFGYATVFLFGWWYLKKARSVYNLNDPDHEWDRAIVDVLTQASGVLKVTLIIGIEMFAFPLYCGSLLDLALLPLFEGATVMSRLTFLCNFPLTSLFMHWLAGTTYMFHFSLFVFMCRKLLRKGVLFFIRDPENNPVRDALDRSVGTHLKKILWSALAYGIMISVFIGGSLWTLSYATAGTGLMPIHYSSNEFVLEFPYDLVLYIVVMPVAVKMLKLHDTAYAINEWWFRKSARALRLTWFLFNERRIDEEGELKLAEDSPYRKYPWPITYFLSYDEASDTVYPVLLGRPSGIPAKAERTLDAKVISDTLPDTADAAGAAGPTSATDGATFVKQDEHVAKLQPAKRQLVLSGRMTNDGWFVRAPTADNIKIVSAQKIFLRVTELNERRDDRAWEEDIYNTDYFQQVYMPPHFTARYRLYIVSVWTFAVLGGVVAIFGPLLAGRGVYSLVVPAGVPYNDVFAFNVGLYALSGIGYIVISARKWIAEATPEAAGQLLHKIYSFHRRAHSIIYSYLMIAIVSPLLAAGIVELYVFIPLHTYMWPPSIEASKGNDLNDPSRYTVELKQVWVLGVLFLQLAVLYVSYNFPHSRLASALRAVFRRGRWVPDARILTRALVVPGLVMSLAAIFLPLALASFLTYVCEAPCLWVLDHLLGTTTDVVILRRFCYPLVAAIVMGLFRVYGIAANFQAWRTLVRDEVYLIGTRVQNYGPVSIPQVRKIDPITGF